MTLPRHPNIEGSETSRIQGASPLRTAWSRQTLNLIGVPTLQESAIFPRNLKRDDYGKEFRMADDIMTIDEVADYLRINKKTAYRLAADSKLPGFKIGGTWRFRRVDVEDWIEREASPKKDSKR